MIPKAWPLGLDEDSPEGRQFRIELINRGPFICTLKDGREGMSVVDFDTARENVRLKFARARAAILRGTSSL